MNGLRGRLLIVACAGLLLNFVVVPLRALSYLSQSDFVPYDAAGRIIRAGGQCLYCIATQEASVHVVAGTANSGGLDTIGGLVFISPPAVARLFAPLAGLDPHLGRVIFMVLSTAGLGLAAWLIAPHWLAGLGQGQRICLVIASIASVPEVIGVAGQIDPLIFTAVVVGITLARRFPVLGGVLIGALVLKPQLFVLVPVALIVSRQWRVLAGTALRTALVATSMFAQGEATCSTGRALWPRTARFRTGCRSRCPRNSAFSPALGWSSPAPRCSATRSARCASGAAGAGSAVSSRRSRWAWCSP
jgi:hypothetical protein